MAKVWQRRGVQARDAAELAAKAARQAIEIRETVETLIEDRGRDNALAWAEHCMVRDPTGGFWRAVADGIRAR